MKYRHAPSICVLLASLAPACGGGDFVGSSGHDATNRDGSADGTAGNAGSDAGLGGSSTGGTDASVGDTGGTSPGSGGSGGRGSGGRGSGGRPSSGGADSGAGGATTMDAGNGNGGASSGGARDDAGGTNSGGTGTGGVGTGGMNGGGTSGSGGGGNGGTCTNPVDWYIDADHDGYGALNGRKISACTQPSPDYSKFGGDCEDGMPDVHPQLTAQETHYFDSPYKTSSGQESFDWDCSGKEDGNPTAPVATKCSLLTLGACGGTGYEPIQRSGNALCGSNQYQTCSSSLALTCDLSKITIATTLYACR
jgi:hypothetical protein